MTGGGAMRDCSRPASRHFSSHLAIPSDRPPLRLQVPRPATIRWQQFPAGRPLQTGGRVCLIVSALAKRFRAKIELAVRFGTEPTRRVGISPESCTEYGSTPRRSNLDSSPQIWARRWRRSCDSGPDVMVVTVVMPFVPYLRRL